MSAHARPRVERVHITVSDNPAVRPGRYASIAHADAMLEQAYADVPAPDGRPFHLLLGSVHWNDGYELRPRVYISARFVREAAADGGILRHALLASARAQASPASYRGFHPELVARYTAEGREVLARIEADAIDDEAHRNVAVPAWSAPSLLPDPAVAIRRLRDRFAGRRRIVAALGNAHDDDDRDGTAYPATNHADVRYVTNYVTIALQGDLRTVTPTAAGVVWNHWRAVRDTIETILRVGDATDEYTDNEGLWVRQLPALVRLLDDARAHDSPLRNGRLTFRPVGRRGEPYPPWVADLRGRSGVYVIRAPGESGHLEIVYVGSSSADRLYETLTRHFQSWRRWKSFWRGGFTEGHDPGLTYERDTAEAAVLVTPAGHALEMERRFIRRLRPRDNLVGQEVEAVPF
ncbi:MAG: hypothetical protein K8M05_32090 [Deltaproteobacteria bacterium]|nr:hypothetical protein [Kofleriaceae bacterium]